MTREALTLDLTDEARQLMTTLANHYETHPESWRRDGTISDDSFCVVRGLQKFYSDPSDYFLPKIPGALQHAIHTRMMMAIREQTGRFFPYGIARWNDDHARDVAQVVKVLRRAATL